jgi:hypothetical protein
MTRTEIKAIRLRIKDKIAELENKLNKDSKRFYNKFENVLRSNSLGELFSDYMDDMRDYYNDTSSIYNNLNESYGLLRDLQHLHQQLLELDVLEQAI